MQRCLSQDEPCRLGIVYSRIGLLALVDWDFFGSNAYTAQGSLRDLISQSRSSVDDGEFRAVRSKPTFLQRKLGKEKGPPREAAPVAAVP